MNFFRGFLGLIFLVLLMAGERTHHEPYSTHVAPVEETSQPLEGRNYVYYTIQPGDTLLTIQRKFRIPSPEAILELNPDLNPERLPPERRIKIPL